MTIVFKYGDRATTGNPVYSSGISCWATVATPYNVTKNLPDFMIFEVQRCDPRCPRDTTQPQVINVGDRYPAYRVRTVGGGAVPESNLDIVTSIPPHSEIWAVSGTFPPFAANPPQVEIPFNGTIANFRDRRGLIGDLVYPTNTDITNFSNLGFPTTVQRGPETFMGTGFPLFDVNNEYLFQYEVSCADYPGFAYLSSPASVGPFANAVASGYGHSPIPGARDNQKFLLPATKNSSDYIVDVLEENSVRKVLRVRATIPTQGFNIWTYYYLMVKSPVIMFSTRIHWSERVPIPSAGNINNNPILKRIYHIFAGCFSPFNIIQKNISLPANFASPSLQSANFAPPTLNINEQDRPVYGPERVRTLNIANSSQYPFNEPFYFPEDENNVQFPYSLKVYGDEIVGTNIYVGAPDTAAPATSALSVITTKQKWMKEGRGHYYYGIIYALDMESPQPFRVRDYYQFKNFDEVGPPEGTYLWAENRCIP